MKRIVLFSMIMAVAASCSNQPITFDDYTETVYFPIQYPVRTLVLGESRLDNEIDLEHAFSVGVCVGGMYSNDNNITVGFEVDASLVDGVTNVKALPTAYYAIESEGSMVIPSGSFNGTARVNLTDAFFEDEESYTGVYVLPLLITSSSRGDILSGTAADGIDDPNIHVSTDWSVEPHDFTLFSIKYINLLHGDFFKRGHLMKDGVLDTEYYTDDLEDGVIVNLYTAGERKSIYTHTFNSQTYDIVVEYSEPVDGVCTVTFSAPEGAAYSVSGSGTCYDNTTDFAQEFGAWLTDPDEPNLLYPHTTVTTNYTIGNIEGSEYQLIDTLVFRNNDVIYEEFTPVLED